MRLGSCRTFVSFIRICSPWIHQSEAEMGVIDVQGSFTVGVGSDCCGSWVYVVMEDRDRERERLRQGKASFGFACQGGFLRYADSACTSNGIEIFRETR